MHLLQKVRRDRASGQLLQLGGKQLAIAHHRLRRISHVVAQIQAIPRGLADPTVATGKHGKNARDGGPIRQQPIGGQRICVFHLSSIPSQEVWAWHTWQIVLVSVLP